MGHDEEIYGSEVLLLSYFYIFLFHLLLSLSLAGLAETRQRQGKAREFWADRQAGRQDTGRQRQAGWQWQWQAGERICLDSFFTISIFLYLAYYIVGNSSFFYIYVRFVQVLPTYFTQTYHTIPNHTVPYRVVPYLPIYIFDLLSTSALLPYVLNERTDGRANGRTDGRTNEGNAA